MTKHVNKDKEYLGTLRDYYARHRTLPSFSSIGNMVGIKSKSAVSVMVNRLKHEGYLDFTPDRRLQPGKRFFERELVNTIRAGQPHPANDMVADIISIDEYLIDSPSRTLMLRVKGDSMVEAGLMPNDIVIVKTGAPAKDGDIVVAVVDNDYTVKYIAHDAKGFYLKPANKNYPPIRAKDHLELYGLVVGSFRKF